LVIKMGKDYYAILGVSRDADEDQIKAAYKKQALKVSPLLLTPNCLCMCFYLRK